nr:glycosyltransferase family 8 protein [Saccharibacter sp. 17.LH.SD]
MNSLYATHKEIKVKRSPIVYIDDQDYTLSRRDIVARITAHENNVKQYLSTRILFGGKINIVISFDDHYVKPAYATINSVLQHTTSCKEITFYVIHDEKLSEKTRNEIRKTYKNKVSIEFLSVGESFINDFPLNRSHVNVNTYYRLLIHKLLGKDIERVIYLDTDIILCEDIVDLWNVDLNHHIIGAVGDESGRVGEWRLFKTQGKTPYINAGVFVFDLKRARERYQNLDFLYADIFYNNIESVIMQDQDILNIAYKNDIYLISLSWNVPSSFYCRKGSHSDGGYEGIEHMFSRKEREEAIKKPKIIHFTGRQKPWKLSCNHPLKALYWQAYEQTEGASFSLRDRVCLWNNYLSVKKNRVLIQTNNKLIEIPFGV